MTNHTVVTRGEWLTERRRLLEKEKSFMRLKDELAAERRALPWVQLEKPYVFDTDSGPRSLSELFGGRSQLIVYHLMFNPKNEVACKNCSFFADHWSAAVRHLSERDVTLLAISRAPSSKLEAFKRRQGWRFQWVSSGEGDFNYDFQVSFRDAEREAGRAIYNYAPLPLNRSADMPGFSVFARDERGAVFHTYSTFARGIELANVTFQLLDLVPKGRDEGDRPMGWVKYGFELPETA